MQKATGMLKAVLFLMLGLSVGLVFSLLTYRVLETTTDPAFRTYYYMWRHEGRRMRQGAAMEGPDYSHWRGVFQLQQSLRILQAIYNQRIKTGKIDYNQIGGVGMGE